MSGEDGLVTGGADTGLVRADALARHYDVGGGLFSKGARVHALAEASFGLDAGRTLAVVGESGCGKSTLARVVTMIEPPSGGTLMLDGRRIEADATMTDAERAELRATVQIVFQNPYGSLNPRHTIGRILEEPLIINRPSLSAKERETRAREMLVMTGLRPEHYDRYPHMFSGGQRQRIAIGRALMLDPKVLVLDEPVSALDLSIQSQVLNLLIDLQRRLGLAYLFISHDLSVVRHMADEVLVMYLGRVVERGPAEAVFGAPRHPYTKALLSATPVADPTRERARIRLEGELPSPLHPPPGCAFHPRCWRADATCRDVVPALERMGPVDAACHHPIEEEVPAG